MKNTTLIKLATVGALLMSAGVGTYAVIQRLSDQTLSTLIGAVAVLAVVLVVGLLFVVRDALQARTLRRQLAQDNYEELKQVALVFKLLGNRAPNVNVRLPEQQQQAMPWLPMLPPGRAQVSGGQAWDFDGTYRDTTVHQDIEIE
jgi:uncharacterized protein (DUF58 family)